MTVTSRMYRSRAWHPSHFHRTSEHPRSGMASGRRSGQVRLWTPSRCRAEGPGRGGPRRRRHDLRGNCAGAHCHQHRCPEPVGWRRCGSHSVGELEMGIAQEAKEHRPNWHHRTSWSLTGCRSRPTARDPRQKQVSGKDRLAKLVAKNHCTTICGVANIASRCCRLSNSSDCKYPPVAGDPPPRRLARPDLVDRRAAIAPGPHRLVRVQRHNVPQQQLLLNIQLGQDAVNNCRRGFLLARFLQLELARERHP